MSDSSKRHDFGIAAASPGRERIELSMLGKLGEVFVVFSVVFAVLRTPRYLHSAYETTPVVLSWSELSSRQAGLVCVFSVMRRVIETC